MAADDGLEPDYRYSLANERTFLSWIRTGLALIAGGIALRAFAEQFGSFAGAQAAGIFATLLGGVLAVLAYRHWRQVQRAMRRGEPLPRQLAAAVVTIGLVVLAGGLLFLVMV